MSGWTAECDGCDEFAGSGLYELYDHSFRAWVTMSSRILSVFLMIWSTCRRCSMCLIGFLCTRFTLLKIRSEWLVILQVYLAAVHPMTEVLFTTVSGLFLALMC